MLKTVFVTGGEGCLDSHCCQAFAETGWNVVVHDDLSRGWVGFVQWGTLARGDIYVPEAADAVQAASGQPLPHTLGPRRSDIDTIVADAWRWHQR